MEKKLNKTTSVALLAAAALGAVALSNKPGSAVYAATNDGYVGTAENSQDVDPNTLTDAQNAAIQQRDDAQNKADEADAATSAASTAAASAAAAQSAAQTSVASASAAVSSAAKNVTPTDGVTQEQKDADITSASSAVTAASAAVSSAQTQQAKKASDVNAAQSKVDAANAALSAAQSTTGNAQKSADVQSAEKAVSDAQAAVDAATSTAQSEAEASSDFYIVSARNQASLAKSNLDTAQATLVRTPSSLSNTVIDGNLADGGTYAYVANNNKWNSNVTTYTDYNGDVNDHVNTFSQDELDALDSRSLEQMAADRKAGKIDDFEYYTPAVGDEYDGDQVVNGQLTSAQQLELNTYAMMLVNKYRAAMGLDPMASTTNIFNGVQTRGVTVGEDPNGMEHVVPDIESSLSKYGLSWSGE
jgi:chemotaxis protein histidine kinase CheA